MRTAQWEIELSNFWGTLDGILTVIGSVTSHIAGVQTAEQGRRKPGGGAHCK